MRELAAIICEILSDYHADLGFNFTSEHILKWVDQFEPNDQEFILSEFLHLLKNGIYIGKSDAKIILLKQLKRLASHFKFDGPISFLKNVEFLNVQGDGKSQYVLLTMLDEELIKNYDFALDNCGTDSKKYVIYLDDILATGGTVFNDCLKWLESKNPDGEENFKKVTKKGKILIVSLFCKHAWGAENVKIRLKMKLNREGLILFQSGYVIENHPTFPNQKMNLAYPVNSGIEEVAEYFENLDAEYKAEYAYRQDGIPVNEQFFSSASNRIRFENIILKKGIFLLGGVANLQVNQRPLGVTNPSKKTFGTGTLFFTWRNVSNTTPIIFWWKITGSNWYPLFPLSNRGKN